MFIIEVECTCVSDRMIRWCDWSGYNCLETAYRDMISTYNSIKSDL
jgi:hypothetical protein